MEFGQLSGQMLIVDLGVPILFVKGKYRENIRNLMDNYCEVR